MLFVVVAAFLLISCTAGSDEKKSLSLKQDEQAASLGVSVKKSNLTPVLLQDENDVSPDDLFGKFHCDRASYYIVKHPDIKLYGAEITRITLFYLDSTLLQTKYETRFDITTVLIRQLGKCRISALNEKNRRIISNEWVVKQSDEGLILHPELDRYELTWRFPDREIRYRVTEDGFVYYERYPGYEQQLKRLESVCR